MSKLEGGKAPNFKLEGSDGKTHTLKDYKGKTVILYFYPRDNTPGCTKEACGFRDLHGKIKSRKAVVLGVSKDSLKAHDKFIADFELPFVLLSDPDAEVMEQYGAWGEKKMYGKSYEGILRSTFVIDEKGTVIKVWPKVKPEDHAGEVLAVL